MFMLSSIRCRWFCLYQSVRKAVLEGDTLQKAFLELRLSPEYIHRKHIKGSQTEPIKELQDLVPQIASRRSDEPKANHFRSLLTSIIEGTHNDHNQIQPADINKLTKQKLLELTLKDFKQLPKKLSKQSSQKFISAIADNVEVIPHDYFGSLIQLCNLPGTDRLKENIFKTAMLNRRILLEYFAALLKTFPDKRSILRQCLLDCLQKGILTKRYFLSCVRRFPRLQKEDLDAVQKMISQGNLGDAWKEILFMHLDHKFYFSAQNKKEVFEYFDEYPKYTHLMLNFLLKNGMNTNEREWTKLRERAKNSELRSAIGLMLRTVNLKLLSPKVREEFLLILWHALQQRQKVAQGEHQDSTAQKINIFIEQNAATLRQLNIQTVKVGSVLDDFSKRMFFPKLTDSTAVSVGYPKSTQRSESSSAEVEAWKKTVEQATAAPEEFIKAAQHLLFAQVASETHIKSIASYLVSRLSECGALDLYKIKDIYKKIKYNLPSNFWTVLEAQALAVAKTEKMSPLKVSALVRSFKLSIFDYSTLLHFEDKLVKGMDSLSESTLYAVVSTYESFGLLGYRLIDAVKALMCNQLRDGAITEKGATTLAKIVKYDNSIEYREHISQYLRTFGEKASAELQNTLIKMVLDLTERFQAQLPADLLMLKKKAAYCGVYLALIGATEPSLGNLIAINDEFAGLGCVAVPIQAYLRKHAQQLPLDKLINIAYDVPLEKMPARPAYFKNSLKDVREYVSVFLMLHNSKEQKKKDWWKEFRNVSLPFKEPLPTDNQLKLLIPKLNFLTNQQAQIIQRALLKFKQPRQLLRLLLRHNGRWSQEFIDRAVEILETSV